MDVSGDKRDKNITLRGETTTKSVVDSDCSPEPFMSYRGETTKTVSTFGIELCDTAGAATFPVKFPE